MVELTEVKASNSKIATTLPPGIVAVFVGATNGIGETTLIQFAKYAVKPQVYFTGRSREAGERIARECKSLSPEGQFTFIEADTSLIRNVDSVCNEIKAKESSINILCLSTGTLVQHEKTEEGFRLLVALAHYSRSRFIENLLPLVQEASSIRRVMSVFAATKEGAIDDKDIPASNMSLIKGRDHLSAVVTLSLESFAKMAPNVSFLHDFPGPVKTGIFRGITGLLGMLLKVTSVVLGPFLYIPWEESGERHLYLLTSARYPAHEDKDSDAVPLPEGLNAARGTDGKAGSGVYSVNEHGESASLKTEEILAKLRREGIDKKVWDDLKTQFERITAA